MASKPSVNPDSKSPQAKTRRLINFDILKALSYILVFYSHGNLSIAIFNDDFRSAAFVAHFLVSALIFSAGYFFTHSWKGNLLNFAKSKFIRLFVPFMIALFLFLITSRIGERPIEDYVWNTNLWFIGQLLIFFSLFVGLEKLKSEWQRVSVLFILLLIYVTQVPNFEQHARIIRLHLPSG